MTDKPTAGMTCDFARVLPGGTMDDATFSDVETALDSVRAPMRGADGRWLTLPERVLALAADLGRRPEWMPLPEPPKEGA